MTYPELLQTTQRLPVESQLQLIQTLFAGLTKERKQPQLLPLFGLSVAELKVIALGQLSPPDAKRLHTLIEQEKQGQSTSPEIVELDERLEDLDQLALLKARALYTLHQLGESLPL